MSQRGGGGRHGSGGGRGRDNPPTSSYRGEGSGGRTGGYGGPSGGRGYGGSSGGRGYGGSSGGGDRGRGRGRGSYGPGPDAEPLALDTWKIANASSLSEEAIGKLSLTPEGSSSKGTGPPRRPGVGKIGRPCVVRANHFPVKLTEKAFHHYDVSISPEVPSKKVCRWILDELEKCYRQSHLGNRRCAYDGKKSLYTAGPFPFNSKEFIIKLEDSDTTRRKEREFKVSIKLVAKIDLHQLQGFLQGKQLDVAQEAIQMLDVVMRAAVAKDYLVIGRSLFSSSAGRGDLGSGFEYWRGYYQSLRPSQLGLSLNVDPSARPFYEPINLTEFLAKYLNLRSISRPLQDADRIKVRRVLKGIIVETSYRGYTKRFKISTLSSESADRLIFSCESGRQMSVAQYFLEQYNIQLMYPFLPCIQAGPANRPSYVPMELCKLVDGQRYTRKLTQSQVTNMLNATCQRPYEREENIMRIIKERKYGENQLVKEFGLLVTEIPVSVDARVLPVPMLQYKDTGKDAKVSPGLGQWNMIGKKMYNGASVRLWTCLNFSTLKNEAACSFCTELVDMCVNKGMEFCPKPVIPIRTLPPGQIERALVDVHAHASKLQLLIIILPDASGSYGNIKRICETELGIVSQCCQPKNIWKLNKQYLENVAQKMNVKAGGINSALCDALERRIPVLSVKPTIILGADVTHAQPGETSTPSIAAVVGSMDWPAVTKYKALVSAQPPRVEIIQDLYKVENDPKRGPVHGGMIRELLIGFRKSTGYRPERIIFYRDGVSEGQFAEVLLYEVDAIRKACASLEEGYLPRLTFVVVQKRHHTRLFAADRNMTDRSGNILPGTVVDTKICHPSQFDFYLCSHAGIKGTSRPTHYHVLHDENYFSADVLQLLTYSLCYTYARCTRAVSVVPPAYYAHHAAFRARYYIEGETSDSGSFGSSTQIGSGSSRPFPKILANVKEVMYYC